MRTRFGERLFQMRRTKRLLQKSVAMTAGIDPSYLASLENGRRQPPEPSTLEKIISALTLNEQEAKQLKFLAELERTILNLEKTAGSLRGGDCLIQLASALPALTNIQLDALSVMIAAMIPTYEETHAMK